MDYGGDVGQMIPETPGGGGRGGADNWVPGLGDQAIWCTEDDYGAWNGDGFADTPSNSNYDGRQSQTRSGSEPPNKKTRGDSQGSGLNRDRDRSKAIGKMFFKTKLCCKFRAGSCPYITNCNFAHGIEELRKPPPNWQEIVAAQEEERGVSSEPREENQIPIISSGLGGETQRSYKGRHCKKFYTEEGCPYGDNCTFLHDEQSRARESVAISLGPTVGSGYGTSGNGTNQKPSNWKTRICNKWEMTGYCPFGSKCHFAHGFGELHRYGGGLVEMEGRDSSTSPDSKQVAVSSKTQTDTVVTSATSVPHTDVYHMGVPSQRSAALIQRQGQRPLQKWKGPDKISRIYGDWIDDNEWEPAR
ncbi:zinc finger CCCH domain-containing protein 56-like [Macadamia integrifolia]|uniref:zinc finger CCCH domain-containing protein 56-like n=1 Tax=Macadamia integrifolia TaxID=60698 RepID=UPI001C4F96B0|nr:zinc finger CCCH domain-containing protein 56-like [Macadamia integrifolia]XP_042487732.1 zinc finger CCCH domain-containing protein 56-like [Macadamia integrifolia]XP_042516597.1 zinc finger CCCH domain-containing protein 56-like [Macadamia integrifolia]XP_042516674.1 zinc finger CCCH domain-containing protein 56-like [Macadamia integrifolia]